jgi:hypothetical protein
VREGHVRTVAFVGEGFRRPPATLYLPRFRISRHDIRGRPQRFRAAPIDVRGSSIASPPAPHGSRARPIGFCGAPDDFRAQPFSTVAICWLKGLLWLARGAKAEALAAFERELQLESRGHLYARECCANTWYAIGAVHLRRGDSGPARAAFEQTLTRVPRHPLARAAMVLLGKSLDADLESGAPESMEGVLARAVVLGRSGDVDAAAALVGRALSSAPPGNAGWLIPVEPLLGVQHARDAWKDVLVQLRGRAV